MPTLAKTNLLPKDGEVYLFDEHFSCSESEEFYNALLKNIAWEQTPIKIFGKWVMQPRLTAWYGNDGKQYSYSGVTLEAKSWNTELLLIKNKIQNKMNFEFNSALLNLYRDGHDYMGWHRDNEKELGAQPVIGSVSFGSSRIFRLQHIKEKNLKVSMELRSGSYLHMQGETQIFWRHCVPKQTSCSASRINITFRHVY
jgi:alkylated DNA repair dioxygenase AlkB